MTLEHEKIAAVLDAALTEDEKDILTKRILSELVPATTEQWGIFYNGQQIPGYNGHETFTTAALAKRSFSLRTHCIGGDMTNELKRTRNLDQAQLDDFNQSARREAFLMAWPRLHEKCEIARKKLLKDLLKRGVITFQRLR